MTGLWVIAIPEGDAFMLFSTHEGILAFESPEHALDFAALVNEEMPDGVIAIPYEPSMGSMLVVV